MQKQLIIVRHAHRDNDKTNPSLDNGLSPKGHQQAKLIEKFYRKQFGKAPALLLSSPKKRCLETLAPLALALNTRVEIDPHLDETGRLEDLSAALSAVKRRWESSSNELTVVCSHGDWIPGFINALFGRSLELSKGAWAQFEREGARTELTWLVQNLDL